MSAYYNFYLEVYKNNKWILFDDLEQYYLNRSSSYLFIEKYLLQYLDCFEISEELIEKYELKNCKDDLIFYRNSFFLLDIENMIKDYENNIHDNDGIISHQDYKKVLYNEEYYPNIIKVGQFNKLPKRIKDNYGYYRWDEYISEYKYLYSLIPLIKDKIGNYELDNIRLVVLLG